MSDAFYLPIKDSELVGNPAVSGGVSIKEYCSKDCGVSNVNNHSGVVVFDYHGVSVIIPGDNEPPSWRSLMEQSDFKSVMKKASVFMASHHGRKSGYCADIFESKPDLCIVSDGRSQDTDATSRYSYHATGWNVRQRSNNRKEKRYCVTTRSDGPVRLEIGKDTQPYLIAEID